MNKLIQFTKQAYDSFTNWTAVFEFTWGQCLQIWLFYGFRHSRCNTVQCNILGSETEDHKDDKRGQHWRHEVDARDHDGITMAVVMHRVVGWICDHGAVTQTQSKEHLRGRLTPHLHLPPNLQLWNKITNAFTRLNTQKSSHGTNISLVNSNCKILANIKYTNGIKHLHIVQKSSNLNNFFKIWYTFISVLTQLQSTSTFDTNAIYTCFLPLDKTCIWCHL